MSQAGSQQIVGDYLDGSEAGLYPGLNVEAAFTAFLQGGPAEHNEGLDVFVQL